MQLITLRENIMSSIEVCQVDRDIIYIYIIYDMIWILCMI